MGIPYLFLPLITEVQLQSPACSGSCNVTFYRVPQSETIPESPTPGAHEVLGNKFSDCFCPLQIRLHFCLSDLSVSICTTAFENTDKNTDAR